MLRGFCDGWTDRQMDICDSRVAFATENDWAEFEGWAFPIYSILFSPLLSLLLHTFLVTGQFDLKSVP